MGLTLVDDHLVEHIERLALQIIALLSLVYNIANSWKCLLLCCNRYYKIANTNESLMFTVG